MDCQSFLIWTEGCFKKEFLAVIQFNSKIQLYLFKFEEEKELTQRKLNVLEYSL